jgi:tetratricopeptide (TPR) repeat protein
MSQPSIADFYIDGYSGACAAKKEMLEKWIVHTDKLLAKSKTLHLIELQVDDFDVCCLLLRKSTLLTSLGRYEEAKSVALEANAIHESPISLYRLACAHYALLEFNHALNVLVKAKEKDCNNVYINNALEAVLARIRSRKDRPRVYSANNNAANNIL